MLVSVSHWGLFGVPKVIRSYDQDGTFWRNVNSPEKSHLSDSQAPKRIRDIHEFAFGEPISRYRFSDS